MKLEELADVKKKHDGTYVGVKFSPETNNRIKNFMKIFDIPNKISSDSFHCTVIYSRKHLPEFKAIGKINPPWIGHASRMDIFTGRDDSKCLVLVFECPKLTARHNEIMKDYDATYDYPEYHCHITLSYNCENFDPTSIKNLKSSLGNIEIVEEYTQDLDLNWAKSNTDTHKKDRD